MSLFKLSNELLHSIAADLELHELKSLILTHSYFSHCLTPYLHKLAIKDHNGTPAICWAAAKGYNSLVKLCLKSCINIDTVDNAEEGNTALILAADAGNTALVETLLANGADIDICNRAGDSAFTLAVQGNRIKVCSLLLRHGATDVNARDGNGDTVLHFTIGCFLSLCAKAQSAEAGTAHKAEMVSQVALIRVLLDNGADMEIKNNRGICPCELVWMSRSYELTELFLKHRYLLT